VSPRAPGAGRPEPRAAGSGRPQAETALPALPVVAIVGRPNVGKSTLFNRIVRQRRAIVDDAPGVTRDRVVAPAEHAGRRFLCVDTGGFEAEAPRVPAAIAAQVRAQALAAVEEADVVVCVLDATAGLGPADAEAVRLLARSGKPLFVAVNKIDAPARDRLLGEFWATGVERLWPVSGAHGRGVEELLDAVVAALPQVPEPASAGEGTRLALMGRPNVGKSSLLNRLLGTERVLVAPEPGTTRDAIDTPVTIEGRPYVLIDTAGVRKRGRVDDPLERHGAVRALGTLTRTDVVLLVLDAPQGMTDQDARLVGRALEAGAAVVLLANKWDAVRGPERDVRRFRRRLAELNPGFAHLPVLCVSAHTGEGLEALPRTLREVERAYRATVPTPVLNRALRDAVAAVAPPSPEGRPLRFLYATQTGTAPPAVIVFASAPARVPPAYVRYLAGRIADAFGLRAVPLRLTLRPRREGEAAGPARGARARPVRAGRPRARGR